MKKIIKFGIPLVGLTIFVIALLFWQKTANPGEGNIKTDFEVKSGSGSVLVVNNLYKEKLIKSRTFFRILLKLKGQDTKIKRGIFPLNDGMSGSEIIEIITSGKTKSIAVTIPEGYNNRQIGDVLTKKGFFESRKEFLEYASNEALLKKYNIPAKTVEGYIFPNTYYFPVGYPKMKIMDVFIKDFLAKVNTLKDFPEDAEKRHNLIILASIVEREAKLKSERALIASVFHNRLRINQPLESCATVQYLFEKPKQRLFYSDLKVKSPYNTYLNEGLPPSPIASPGIAAIEATLHPKHTKYKYFVVKGDGSHVFSVNYYQHVKAKKKYLFR